MLEARYVPSQENGRQKEDNKQINKTPHEEINTAHKTKLKQSAHEKNEPKTRALQGVWEGKTAVTLASLSLASAAQEPKNFHE